MLSLVAVSRGLVSLFIRDESDMVYVCLEREGTWTFFLGAYRKNESKMGGMKRFF